MNPQLQEILHQITTSIKAEFDKQNERIEQLENEMLAMQSALSNASACLRKATRGEE
jgi:polyhydroxyalkanoate synthesis regulator phasin